MNNEQQIIETKIWAIDQIVKLSKQQDDINELISLNIGTSDKDFNMAMWRLKRETTQSEIDELKKWVVQH